MEVTIGAAMCLVFEDTFRRTLPVLKGYKLGVGIDFWLTVNPVSNTQSPRYKIFLQLSVKGNFIS